MFDFLYNDARRVGSFLAQMDPNGILQSLTASATQSSGFSNKSSLSGGASLPPVAKIDKSAEKSTSESSQESLSRTYDPFWLNATVFIERLSEANLLNTNLLQASVGGLIQLTGYIWLTDTRIIKAILAIPALKQQMRASMGSQPTTKGAVKGKGMSEAELAMELLPLLPHGIQATFLGSDAYEHSASVWFSVRDDSLSTTPEDIYLKHGSHIMGRWHLLGVVDALPDFSGPVNHPAGEGFINGLATMASAIRPTFGRPLNSYGLTPLLIYREAVLGTSIEDSPLSDET